MKPLFIPLKAEFFAAFAIGAKNTEYRRRGPRWNAETCAIGRPVILARGYGKKHRLSGVIAHFHYDTAPAKLPGWIECYGSNAGDAACIGITVGQPIGVTCEDARLRGRFGSFRVMKSEPCGYRVEVKLQCPIEGREWGTIETYDYLSNARGLARRLFQAESLFPRVLTPSESVALGRARQDEGAAHAFFLQEFNKPRAEQDTARVALLLKAWKRSTAAFHALEKRLFSRR